MPDLSSLSIGLHNADYSQMLPTKRLTTSNKGFIY